MKKNIVLIGMPGCGKSSIGKILSGKLNIPFCDIDEYIEEKHNRSIKEIFKEGEKYFRKLESDAVKEVSEISPQVISTGGGVIVKSSNITSLKEKGIVIFINRPVDKIINDVDISKRPLLKDGKDKIYKLFDDRYDLYKKYCDYEIMNEKNIQDVIKNIVNLIINKNIM